MKTQMYYCMDYSAELEQRLIGAGVKYERWENLLTFYIYREDAAWEQLKEYLPHTKPLHLVFSQKELDEAKWLTMRSTNWKLVSMNGNTFRFVCPNNPDAEKLSSFHRKKMAPYEFKPIKWTKNNHFYAADSGGIEMIFCDDFAMDFIRKHALQGVSFEDVMWYKKNVTLPNAHLLVFEKHIPEEAVVIGKDLTQIACPTCGRIAYSYDNEFRLQLKDAFLDDTVDFYATPEMFVIFGTGSIQEITIVSQRAYAALKHAGLIRNLRFEPVVLL